MNINLHIERLVLDGITLAPNQRHLLQASVEAELTRLLGEGGLNSQLSEGLSLPRLQAPQVNINPTTSPAHLGQQIAASVYQNIGHQGMNSGSKGQ
jgi:hypothetical protein